MSKCTATALVCDDCTISLNGKYNIFGVYTSDITILHEEMQLGQLVFLFSIEGSLDDFPTSLEIEITLPGESPLRQEVPMPGNFEKKPDRTAWFARIPFPVWQPILRPGKIHGRVILGGEETLIPTVIWISQIPSIK